MGIRDENTTKIKPKCSKLYPSVAPLKALKYSSNTPT